MGQAGSGVQNPSSAGPVTRLIDRGSVLELSTSKRPRVSLSSLARFVVGLWRGGWSCSPVLQIASLIGPKFTLAAEASASFLNVFRGPLRRWLRFVVGRRTKWWAELSAVCNSPPFVPLPRDSLLCQRQHVVRGRLSVWESLCFGSLRCCIVGRTFGGGELSSVRLHCNSLR